MSSVRSIRVLVVDDEPSICVVSKGFLEESKDIEVEIAYSASKARTALDHGHFDAIVCDYQMPDEDGIQFLKWLRWKGLRIPFIIFTCRGMEEVVIEALNNGADSYLQKGGESRTQYVELECRIRAAVQQHRREEALWESELRFDQLAALSGTVTWEADGDGLFTFVSSVS
ncbi:MAG: response regulator, partial [Methanomassiliicoccales archaeon]